MKKFLSYSICQSIGVTPFFSRNSLVLLNGLLPKNPLYAESGLGCGLRMIRCFGLSSLAAFSPAGRPQSMNTIGRSSSFTISMIASVKVSQPNPWWLKAIPLRTVKIVLSRRTPSLAHFAKWPDVGAGKPKSLFNSLKIFLKMRGPLYHLALKMPVLQLVLLHDKDLGQ